MKSILTHILLCLLFLQTTNDTHAGYFECASDIKKREDAEANQRLAKLNERDIKLFKDCVFRYILPIAAMVIIGRGFSYANRYHRRYRGYIDGVEKGSQPCINMTSFPILNGEHYARSFASLTDNRVSTFDNFNTHHFNEGLDAGEWHGKVACRLFRGKHRLKKAYPILSKLLKRHLPKPNPKKCFNKHFRNSGRKN